MCNPASMVVTKEGKVFYSRKKESHEEIIDEFGLSEGIGATVGEANFVRIEINPPSGDMRKPLMDWIYKLDETNPPAWYDAKQTEVYVRKELVKWFSEKVIVDQREKVQELKEGQWYVLSSSVVARGSSRVEALGLSSVVAYDQSTIIAYVKIDKKNLKSTKAVLVDRSGDVVKCYVGKKQKVTT